MWNPDATLRWLNPTQDCLSHKTRKIQVVENKLIECSSLLFPQALTGLWLESCTEQSNQKRPKTVNENYPLPKSSSFPIRASWRLPRLHLASPSLRLSPPSPCLFSERSAGAAFFFGRAKTSGASSQYSTGELEPSGAEEHHMCTTNLTVSRYGV